MAHQRGDDEHTARRQAHQPSPDEGGDAVEPGREPRPRRGQHGHDQTGSPSAQVPDERPAAEGPQNHGHTDDADRCQRAATGVRHDNGKSPLEGPKQQTCRPCVQEEANRGGRRAARRMRGHGPVTVYVMGGRCMWRSVQRSHQLALMLSDGS